MKNHSGKVDVFLGLQWGDEGKGKEIDEALSNYDSVCRFQGADNAGHSYKFDGISVVGHLMPSGVLHKHVNLIIGNGVLVNPASLIKEKLDLKEKGIDVNKRLFISERAKLVTYLHPFLDAAEEHRMGKSCVGSTLRGVGPAYQSFKGRQILLIGDILRLDILYRLNNFIDFQMATLRMYSREYGYVIPLEEISERKSEWFFAIKEVEKLNICDISNLLRQKLSDGKMILAEGAQGVMLDNDFGDYPFVTSSNTLTANACLGLGIPHQSIGEVYGVIKAYTTKVGGGSFPSRIKDEEKEKLFQKLGHEFGATTGRPRMCGWNDMVALKRAVYLSGVTQLCINKTDICPVDEIEVVTHYLDHKGNHFKNFPLHLDDVNSTERIKFKGWGEGASGLTNKDDLPEELVHYIQYLQSEFAPLKIKVIGTGPGRGESVKW